MVVDGKDSGGDGETSAAGKQQANEELIAPSDSIAVTAELEARSIADERKESTSRIASRDTNTCVLENGTTSERCGACGKSGNDLKKCTACKSIYYCSVECQKAHRKVHRRECKKTEKELEEAALFAPPPPREDCVLCCLPLPILEEEVTYMNCCGNMICCGCLWESRRVLEVKNETRAATDPPLPPLKECCAFCRQICPKNGGEFMMRLKTRMVLNDPYAFTQMAEILKEGRFEQPRDESTHFEHMLRAAELGSRSGHYNLAVAYADGSGVERNPGRERNHLEKAAKAGHIVARHNLGCFEGSRGNMRLASRHYLISAAAGCKISMKEVGIEYREGFVSKKEYEKALRAHHNSQLAEQSKERDRGRIKCMECTFK